MTSDIVKLRALRAANLEQLSAEIDKESVKADFGELNGKLRKNGQTVGGLKQMVVSNASPLPNVQVPSLREGGRTPHDVTRLVSASSNALDNVPAIMELVQMVHQLVNQGHMLAIRVAPSPAHKLEVVC